MLRALYLSFYSKDFYRDVGQNWRGLGLSYLFLLMVIYCIPLTFVVNQGFLTIIDTQGQEIIDKLPVMTIKSGRLSIPNPQPYMIYTGDTFTGTHEPKPLIIFDNTGAHKLDDLFPGQVLITDRFVHIRDNNVNGEIRSVALAKTQDIVIGHDMLNIVADAAKRWFMPFCFVTLLVSLFVIRAIQALIYGLLGLLFNKAMTAFLDYPQLVRLSVVSLTPVLFIDMLVILFSPHLAWGWLGFFLAMTYLVFGIRANRELIT